MGRRPISQEDAARGRVLGARLRDLRAAAGHSQEALARVAGISTASLRKIEAGAVANPGLFTILALARALGVGLSELLVTDGSVERADGPDGHHLGSST